MKFIAEIWLCAENVAEEKYGSLLSALKKAGAKTGTTYVYSRRLQMMNSVHSDFILTHQKRAFDKVRFSSINLDLET